MFVKTLEPYHSDQGSVDLNAEFIREVFFLSMLRVRSDLFSSLIEFNTVDLSLAIEYIPITLDKYMSVNKDITLLDFKHIIYQIILGLHHLQQLNTLHRDIKPENIMITNDDKVKLIDFGISAYNYNHFIDWDRTGTEGYKAPECYLYWPFDQDNELLRFDKMDIWSLGIVILDSMYKTREAFDSYDTDLSYLLYYAYLSTGEIDDLYLVFIERLVSRKHQNVITLTSSLRSYAPEYKRVLLQEGFIETIKGLCSIDVFSSSTPIHHLSKEVTPLINQMIMFSPRSRYSISDLLLDPFFVQVRDYYNTEPYDVYKPKEKEIRLNNRESIIRAMVDLLLFMEGKWVYLLNAIHLFDQYLMTTELDLNDRDEQTKILVIACVLVSAKLYRYIYVEDDEYIDDRREAELIYWPMTVYKQEVDWADVILMEQELVKLLYDRLYVPKSVFTNTKDDNIKKNYLYLLTFSDYTKYTNQEKVTYCNKNHSEIDIDYITQALTLV